MASKPNPYRENDRPLPKTDSGILDELDNGIALLRALIIKPEITSPANINGKIEIEDENTTPHKPRPTTQSIDRVGNENLSSPVLPNRREGKSAKARVPLTEIFKTAI